MGKLVAISLLFGQQWRGGSGVSWRSTLPCRVGVEDDDRDICTGNLFHNFKFTSLRLSVWLSLPLDERVCFIVRF